MHRRRFLTLSALAAAVGTAMPSSAEDPKSELHMPRDRKIHTGGSRMIDIGDSRHVWTKKVGSGETKVLLLHGGPGADHCYFECFEDFLPQNGIEFYYYDQLDSTNSDKPNDPALWTVERYRDEVEAVRKGLGLESFYLYGHSWGGMLAIEYALAYPQHLRGLVISNMTAGIQAYQKYAALLRSQLPVNVIAVLDKYEKAGDYKSPEYQQVVLEQVYSRHICRLNPCSNPCSAASAISTNESTTRCRGPTNSSSPAAKRTGSAGTICRRSARVHSPWALDTTR
ncbi:MAG TPA: proline iminopeptidase-family hydrolase [Acidobacteriaceae bacterium]